VYQLQGLSHVMNRALRHQELLEMVCYNMYTREVDPALPDYLTRSLHCRYWHPDEAA
jgi:hypothetical protein